MGVASRCWMRWVWNEVGRVGGRKKSEGRWIHWDIIFTEVKHCKCVCVAIVYLLVIGSPLTTRNMNQEKKKNSQQKLWEEMLHQ